MPFVVFIAITAAAAGAGALFMPGEWYAALQKPSWTPPNGVFAPVWTILYIMIAVAGSRVWTTDRWSRGLILWGIALALNAAWSWLFFGQHWIGGAFIDICLLWLTIAAFVVATWSANRTASLLFAPYLCWVSFATALNASIWLLNH